MKMKFCKKCRTKLPLTAFYKNEYIASGVSTYCMQCEPIEENVLSDKVRICPKCLRLLPLIAFYKNRKNKKSGLMCYCKECQRKKHYKYDKSLIHLDKAKFIFL